MVTKYILTAALAVATVAVLAGTEADAVGDRVRFPAGYMNGVHYGTVRRGNMRNFAPMRRR